MTVSVATAPLAIAREKSLSVTAEVLAPDETTRNPPPVSVRPEEATPASRLIWPA
jgi:hypothetical protein